jgi:1-acyl-sn-glycerol-3-phosphate acyltransferase
MNTWNDATPPDLPPLTLRQRVRGTVRVGLFVGLTLVALGLFLIGRGLRRLLGRWVTFHFGVAWLWSRAGLAILGLRREVSGRPIARGAMVANHCSWLDILALRSCRLIYFVAKAEVADWPGVGFITRVTGTVFIERRRAAAKRQEQVLLERIAADQVLCFFPEGTSTDGLRVLPFKSSLFSAFHHDGHAEDLMIQPVTIRYRPGPGLPDAFYGWWGGMGFEAHIWQVACRSVGGVAEVVFHEPVRPRAFPDRKALAAHCGAAVAAPFGAPPPGTDEDGAGDSDGLAARSRAGPPAC